MVIHTCQISIQEAEPGGFQRAWCQRPSCETLSQKQRGKEWWLRWVQTKPEGMHRCVSKDSRACTKMRMCQRVCTSVWVYTRGHGWVCEHVPEGVYGSVSTHWKCACGCEHTLEVCMGVWAHTRGHAWGCEHTPKGVHEYVSMYHRKRKLSKNTNSHQSWSECSYF